MDVNDIKRIENSGSPEELYELGEAYWSGEDGIEQDYKKAVECYTKAADEGHLESIYSLGLCYANGRGTEQDPDTAYKLLAYAVDNGHVLAAKKLGEYLYWGECLPKDKAKGFQYLKYAADNGDAYSMAIVGEDYIRGVGAYEGWGPAKDQDLGREYLEKSCELDSPYGLFLVGNKYKYGFDGFPENLEYGVKLLKKAAELGHHYAQLQYAIACWNGDGTPKDEQEYARWLKISADNGNEEAAIRLGFTKLIGVVEGVRFNSQQELYETVALLDDALENNNEFLNQEDMRNVMEGFHEEEERLGRKLDLNDVYGYPQAAANPQGRSNKSSGGCYIATAVYGSYDCPQVWTLRCFRDYFLAGRWYGRAFIKFYYAVSPTMVKYFGETKLFKRYFKSRLDKFVSELNNHGYDDKPYCDK